jgi:hypothetical protein
VSLPRWAAEGEGELFRKWIGTRPSKAASLLLFAQPDVSEQTLSGLRWLGELFCVIHCPPLTGRHEGELGYRRYSGFF